MKKTKFTETQIIFALRQSETGVSDSEVCRKMGISDTIPMVIGRKARYGGMKVSDVKKMKALEEENSRQEDIFTITMTTAPTNP